MTADRPPNRMTAAELVSPAAAYACAPAVRIIPCLDVDAGRVVKGVNFVDLVDAGDPVECARQYDRAGADEIVFLDITASSDGRDIMTSVVRRTAQSVFIPITVGGGIRCVDDVRAILASGADKVSVNSAAVKRPQLVAEIAGEFGRQCLVVAVDARFDTEAKKWFVYTHGGRSKTDIDVIAWCAQVARAGAGEILLTSMDRDGTRQGFDLDLLRAVREVAGVPLIASGGVGELAHLVDGAVIGGADAVLAASIFHFGIYTIAEAKQAMAEAGICIRPVEVAPPSTRL